MKCEYPKKSKKKKKNKLWLPRPSCLIPAGQTMKTIKDYNRKREKSVKRFINEY